ncbi:MAG: hypothetical protein LJF30_10500 [Acidobacteria bacterium]|jgi:hypothetical protein|nr:hypothetical protein [Acidobacteriota bacterium]
MTHGSKTRHLPRWTVVLAVVAMTGCGGSSEEENYPVLFPQYGGAGSWPGASLAQFDQEYSSSDGESWKNICTGIIDVLSQDGAAWTGRAMRGLTPGTASYERCHSAGEIAGEVHMDGSIHFTLAQERWGSCTALGSGEYSGQLNKNRFYAEGTTRLRCDDGREATVTEIMFGEYPAPEGSHDT